MQEENQIMTFCQLNVFGTQFKIKGIDEKNSY